ncbi:MAG: hypothetical protein LW847_01575, partial [Burkholderiales bacterium]|nr:hypothetical protein [Burkholderiales bacterium]
MQHRSRRDLLRAGALATLPALPRAAAARGAADNTLRLAFLAAETGFDPAQVQDAYSRRVIM